MAKKRLVGGSRVGVAPVGEFQGAGFPALVEIVEGFVGEAKFIEVVGVTAGEAGVALGDQLGHKTLAEASYLGGVHGTGGKVDDVFGVRYEVIKFGGITPTEVERPMGVAVLGVTGRDEGVLRGATINIEVSGFWIASWPTIRGEVVEIHQIPLDDASNGVTSVSGTSRVVTFTADQNMITGGINLA